MITLRSILNALACFACALIFASVAHAQSQRTFVSVFGNDANTASLCSTSAPCRTFGAAQGVTNAGGEIVTLTSGGYGAVTITKAIQITSPTGVYAAITQIGAGDAITIAAGATDIVVIRGLTLNGLSGANDGIDFDTGAALHVENCVINGFTQRGIRFNAAGLLYVKDTIIRNGGDIGVRLETATDTITASFINCRIENNGGDGIVVSVNAQVSIINTISAGNVGNGFFVDNTGEVTISRSAAANNGNGFNAAAGGEMSIEYCISRGNTANGVRAVGPGTMMRVSNSMSVNNDIGFLQATGATFDSRLNNTVRGNTTNDTSGTINPITAT